MRIVQLLPSLDIGGMERLAVDLARRQAAEGHQAFICCTSHPGQLAPEAEAAGVGVCAFAKNDGFSPRLVGALARKFRELRPDIVHVHNALVLHYGIAAARLAGVRAVVNTRHGGNMNWDPHCEKIWRRSVSWADALIFISEGVRDFYVTKDRLSLNNTKVIYNGIDLDKFAARPAQPGTKRPRFRFGAVGRLVPAKDHVTLVRAFHIASSGLPEAELHILGDGPCRKQIAETAESLGIANRVVLHGAGYDVAGFLSGLDAFVLSSIDEGLPISLMEALAAGLPAISTLLPGLPELAPPHVMAGYCQPREPHLLAELMTQTAGRDDLAVVGQAAREWARRFALAETWRQYHTTFEEILRKKRRRWSVN